MTINMRKCVVLLAMIMAIGTIGFSLTCCSEKKTAPVSDSIIIDTLPKDTAPPDTVENIIAETPMPKAADELFDDFFFNFAANQKLQLKRIKFPLLVSSEDSVEHSISADDWTTEHFFMDQDYYTLIFNSVKQMSIVKDTTVSHVSVEKIYLDEQRVKKYVFDRINGKWMMTAIRNEGLGHNKNASFLEFYCHFATDTAFQVASIHDPLDFTGPSPVDEFETMDGFIAPEQWLSFAPELPQNMIYNILYDEEQEADNTKKIFVIRGISNGQEAELTFRIKEDRWKLVKLNM